MVNPSKSRKLYADGRAAELSQYYIDHFRENAVDELTESLPSKGGYALIDAGFDPEIPQFLQRKFEGLKMQSLYAGKYTAEGIDAWAPYLVELPSLGEIRRTLLADLIQRANAKPMLSFLAGEGATSPMDHLQRQMEAQDEEGKVFVIRLADTRALHSIFSTFDVAQRTRLLSGGATVVVLPTRRDLALSARRGSGFR